MPVHLRVPSGLQIQLTQLLNIKWHTQIQYQEQNGLHIKLLKKLSNWFWYESVNFFNKFPDELRSKKIKLFKKEWNNFF